MARVRRSVLFVPGSDRAALRGALESGPDTLVVDLEDTVTPVRKHAARVLAVAFLGEPAPAGTERAARVNSPATPYFSDDLPAVIAAGADALVIPKGNSAGEIRAVDDQVARTEVERAPARLGEAPAADRDGARRAQRIRDRHRLPAGRRAPLGPRIRHGTILRARCQVVLAAGAAGRDAIDALFMNPTDADGFRGEAREGQRLGGAGKLLLHSDQVRLVHEIYAPSDGEIAHARRVVQAFDEAAAAGTGMFLLDGRVIDLPVVEAERAVRARARRAGTL